MIIWHRKLIASGVCFQLFINRNSQAQPFPSTNRTPVFFLSKIVTHPHAAHSTTDTESTFPSDLTLLYYRARNVFAVSVGKCCAILSKDHTS